MNHFARYFVPFRDISLLTAFTAVLCSCTPGFKIADLATLHSASSGTIATSSANVYSGCTAPPSQLTGKSYYSDPVNGLMSNDGSAAHPWPALSSLLVNGKLPASVHGGDMIYLRTGNHGSAAINSVYNTAFVTITNAPGNVPSLKSLAISGASHLVISGLKFEYLNSQAGYNKALTVGADGNTGRISDNIVLTGNTFQSQSDVSAWSTTDWQNLALFSGINATGSCVAITGNSLRNLKFGIGISGSKILVRENTIDYFSGDGIDYSQGVGPGTLSEVEISHNRITNSLDILDGNHDDGIQGYVMNGTTAHSILIDSNVVIAKLDPNLPFPGNMQGIDEFNGSWDGMRITNNVVVATAYHGIYLSDATNAEIINNTVFGNFTGVSGDKDKTWIGVGQNEPGVVIRNNVAALINAPAGVSQDHNVLTYNPVGLFQAFDRTLFSYDFTPGIGSAALKVGSSLSAPTIDITGAARTSLITVGAYQ